MKTNNWLALLLVASVATWSVGCGGGDEGKKDAGKDDGKTEQGHGGHDGKDDGKKDDGKKDDTAAKGDTAEDAVRAMADAIKSQQPGKVWDLMPATYQDDVNEIVHTFAEKMPEDAWNPGMDMLRKTVGVLKSKKEFVLNNQYTLFIPNFDAAEFSGPYDSVVSVLETVLESDATDLSQLRTADVGELSGSLGTKLMKTFETISAKLPGDSYQEMIKTVDPLEIKTIASTDDTATLEITKNQKKVEFDGETGEVKTSWETATEEVEFVKVEGKWIPKEMADEFKGDIAKAREQLAGLTPEVVDQGKQQVLGVIGVFEPLVDDLAAAEDQQSFDAAVNMLIGKVQEFQGGGAGPEDTADPGDTDDPGDDTETKN